MGHKFAEIAFTDQVKQVQSEQRSRAGYASMEHGEDFNHLLSQREAEFIEARDSFYMASVSETGWPYVQHRGGPKGFMRVLDANTIGFAEFSGNRQYISTGNFLTNDRVSLIFMDYPNRTRMKVLGRVESIAADDWETLSKLEVAEYRARIERGFIIKIEAFDWNCPQHITPRYTDEDIEDLIAPLKTELQSFKKRSTLNKDINAWGNGPLKLIVSGIRQLTSKIRAYELRGISGTELPPITAGAHIKLPFLLGGELQYRHYSICSNPNRRDIYEIAVQREQDGTGGSKTIHQTLALGQHLNIDLPENYFPLQRENHIAVLIAAGIGITPIKAMAQELQSKGYQFEIHYAGRSRKEMAFQDRLAREFGEAVHFYPSDEERRLCLNAILKSVDPSTVIYACGPGRLIDDLITKAEQFGVSSEQVKFERFNASGLQKAKSITLKLQRSEREIEVSSSESILDALLKNNIPIAFSCKTGSCKTCKVEVLEGEPMHLDSSLTDVEKQLGLMCPCVSRAESDSLTLAI